MISDPTLTRYAHASDEDLMAALTKLSPKQCAALTALAGSATHAEAAEAAGVARETVTRWLNHHPQFQAAHGTLRNAIDTAAHDRLRTLRTKALDALHTVLDRPDVAPSDVVAVARLIGLDTPSSSTPAPTAVEILDRARELTRFHCPPPPRGRDTHDIISDLNGHTEIAEAARIARLTLTRLADASGIDDLDDFILDDFILDDADTEAAR